MNRSRSNLDRLHLPPRPANAREELEKILTALVEDFGAEKIIAFGSCVRGDVTEHSDVDLCVVRQHPAHCSHPRMEAGLAVARTRTILPSHLLVLTPDQWDAHRACPFGVYQEITHRGVQLYAR